MTLFEEIYGSDFLTVYGLVDKIFRSVCAETSCNLRRMVESESNFFTTL